MVPATAQSSKPQYNYGGLHSATVSRDRFINKFKQQTAQQNLEAMGSLRTRSQYEFNRNLVWLKGYAKLAVGDQEFKNAFLDFLSELAVQMRYFPDDIFLLTRVVEGLGEMAAPIGAEVTLFMEINWSHISKTNNDYSLLESTLILLKWHKDVESYYTSNWRAVAKALSSSEICIASSSCVERARKLTEN